MQLTSLTIQGFRSYGADIQTIPLKQKLTAFVGLNSSGKTTTLEALRKLFGDNSYLHFEDFHVAPEEADDPPTEKNSA
jgi:putative ATP-dependent endonuclease of the OLD family